MKRLLVVLIIAIASAASGADFRVKSGVSLHVDADMPTAKVGGGDFYSLNLVPANGDYGSFSYTEKNGGVDITFEKPGSYQLHLIVNHITKSSCASVKSEEYKNIPLNINVTE